MVLTFKDKSISELNNFNYSSFESDFMDSLKELLLKSKPEQTSEVEIDTYLFFINVHLIDYQQLLVTFYKGRDSKIKKKNSASKPKRDEIRNLIRSINFMNKKISKIDIKIKKFPPGWQNELKGLLVKNNFKSSIYYDFIEKKLFFETLSGYLMDKMQGEYKKGKPKQEYPIQVLIGMEALFNDVLSDFPKMKKLKLSPIRLGNTFSFSGKYPEAPVTTIRLMANALFLLFGDENFTERKIRYYLKIPKNRKATTSSKQNR